MATAWYEGVKNRINGYAPDSTKLLGFSWQPLTASMLLLIAGLIVAGIAIGSVILAPVLFLLSPILVPVGVLLFVTFSGLIFVGILVLGLILGVSWLYKYVKGMNPPGSDKLDYVRFRIAHTASHVKDRAMEYGGYLQGKGRDAAPGA